MLLGLPHGAETWLFWAMPREEEWSPQRSGGGHTSITSHGYYRCSNASYGGRCPVGQQPNSTKVEGRCLPDGWRLPRPVNPGGGLTPEREGWAPGQARDTTEGKCSIGPAGPVS